MQRADGQLLAYAGKGRFVTKPSTCPSSSARSALSSKPPFREKFRFASNSLTTSLLSKRTRASCSKSS